jgi:Sec-independent protein secretion pathway component TatC
VNSASLAPRNDKLKGEARMTGRLVVSAAIMFVMGWALSFVVHGILLGADYYATPGMRPPEEAQRIISFMILAQALFGIAFAWVYEQGRDDRPWFAQGVRFGIAIAFLTVIPTYLIYHVVTPVSFTLALKQIGYDTIRVLLMGIVVAWINR